MSPCSAPVRRQGPGITGLTMPHHCSQHLHLGKGAKGISGILSHWKWTSAVDGWGQGPVAGARGPYPLILFSLPFLAALLWKPGLFPPCLQGRQKVKAITLQPFPAPSSPGAGSRSAHIPSQHGHVAPHAIPSLEDRWHGSHGIGRMGWGNRVSGLELGKLCWGTGRAGLEKPMSWAGRSWGAGESGLDTMGNWAVRAGRTGLSN